ncbi:MAG: hypothetical protein RJA70_1015 [Pseudomonadota bacterium]|jgi:hypothetical protein
MPSVQPCRRLPYVKRPYRRLDVNVVPGGAERLGAETLRGTVLQWHIDTIGWVLLYCPPFWA